MTLESRLNWEEHIKKLRTKTLKKIYSAICRTKMDYGYQLYNTASAGRKRNYEENEGQ